MFIVKSIISLVVRDKNQWCCGYCKAELIYSILKLSHHPCRCMYDHYNRGIDISIIVHNRKGVF